MCLQAVTATFLGIERARAVMEWESMQGSALLRTGAVVALAAGAFVAFAVTKRPTEEQREVVGATRWPPRFGHGAAPITSHPRRRRILERP